MQECAQGVLQGVLQGCVLQWVYYKVPRVPGDVCLCLFLFPKCYFCVVGQHDGFPMFLCVAAQQNCGFPMLSNVAQGSGRIFSGN